jgi:hypothetical protein
MAELVEVQVVHKVIHKYYLRVVLWRFEHKVLLTNEFYRKIKYLLAVHVRYEVSIGFRC